MNKKCVINLKTKPPEKDCSKIFETPNPDSRQFSFCPKAFAYLNDFVINLSLETVEKKINLVIKETPDFDVIRWLNYLTDKQHTSEKSPFSDVLETNMALLTFKDTYGNPMATMKFQNLQVVKNHCYLGRDEDPHGIVPSKTDLYNCIELKYQYSEHAVIEEVLETDGQMAVDNNPVVDKEWTKKAPSCDVLSA